MKRRCMSTLDDQERRRRCFWCGRLGAATKDHVFPCGLFPEPMPEGVTPITVPACRQHNGAFNLDDSIWPSNRTTRRRASGHIVSVSMMSAQSSPRSSRYRNRSEAIASRSAWSRISASGACRGLRGRGSREATGDPCRRSPFEAAFTQTLDAIGRARSRNAPVPHQGPRSGSPPPRFRNPRPLSP
jgi:hypothetical protein